VRDISDLAEHSLTLGLGLEASSVKRHMAGLGVKIVLRLEVLTAVSMKMAVFWVVAPCRRV
jgi:hypothetical protein